MDRDHDSTIKQDFRHVTSSVKQLGAHAASAAREWINERKHTMTNRNERNEFEAQERYEPRGQQAPTQGFQNSSYRSSGEYNQNESMRGYGEGSSQGSQGVYGVHQREGGDFANRDRTETGEWREPDTRAQGSYAPRATSAYGQPSQPQAYGQSSDHQAYGQPQGYAQQQYGQQSHSQDDSRQRYGQSQPSSQSQYGPARAGYGQAPSSQSGSTQQPGGYGSQSPGYSQANPGYHQPSQGYSQRPDAYGQSGVGQGQSANAFGYGQPGAQMHAGAGSVYGSPYSQGQQQATHRGKGPKGYARSDDRIQEDLNERLFHDDEIDASDVEVKVSNGVVSLEGTISERRLKYRIEDIAESCSGVKDVANNLRVQASTSTNAVSTGGSSASMGYGGSVGTSNGGRQDADMKSSAAGKPASTPTRGNAG